MTVSLSVCVRPFVPFFFSLVSLKSVAHLKCYKASTSVKDIHCVSRKFQGCFKQVSRVFQGSLKGVSRKFQGCFKEVSRVFQGSLKGVSRVF